MPDTASKEKPVLLVVDDEEGPRASLKVVFKNDFDILLAANGTDALRLARERKPDVAILDILMPGMSGVDVLRELKALDEDIEVMMLTAYETLDTARQALRLGAREYLNKPFDISAIRTAAAKALARRRNNIELRGARAQLSALQREISTSPRETDNASNVVHDLNNPLTVISGYIELLDRQMQNAGKIEGEQLDHVKTSIARVRAQAERCMEISRRYLSERRRETHDTSSVGEVLRDVHILIEQHPSASGNTIALGVMDQATRAAINATDLLRIVLNLTINALQATDAPHHIEVACETLPGGCDTADYSNSETERFFHADNFAASRPLIAIRVSDNGPGIPPGNVRRLFDEQFTTKPAGKGSGIGLGSVKALVLAAGGATRMSTRVGEGTEFTVLIPAA